MENVMYNVKSIKYSLERQVKIVGFLWWKKTTTLYCIVKITNGYRDIDVFDFVTKETVAEFNNLEETQKELKNWVIFNTDTN